MRAWVGFLGLFQVHEHSDMETELQLESMSDITGFFYSLC